MKIIYNDIFLTHQTGNHPENKKRLESYSEIKQTNISDGLSYLGLVHNGQYIEDIKEKCSMNIPLCPDTICSEKSFEAATLAVGATIMASQSLDFALVRPPGHHAFPGKASGFCIFNNIAIATQKLVDEGKRVLIFDFDGHYGDGTSSIFYDTDKVLFWSIHQHPAFPHTGGCSKIGEGKGKGFNINVTMPAGSGDDVFMDAVKTFLPIAKKFKPDIVAISAGFDAHKSDMLLDLNISMDSYFKIGRILHDNFKHVFAVLEGGYNPDILEKSIENFIDGINNQPQKHFERLSETEHNVFLDYEIKSNELLGRLKDYWDI